MLISAMLATGSVFDQDDSSTVSTTFVKYISEEELCHDIVYALTGVETTLFYMNTNADRSRTKRSNPYKDASFGVKYDTFALRKVSQQLLIERLQWFMQMMDSTLRLRTFVHSIMSEEVSDDASSSIVYHLMHAVKVFVLDEVDLELSKVLHSFGLNTYTNMLDSDRITLLGLRNTFMQLGIPETVSFFERLIIPAAESNDIIGKLYEAITEVSESLDTDNTFLKSAMARTFMRACRPLFLDIERWIDGIPVVSNAFFIKPRTTSSGAPLRHTAKFFMKDTIMDAYQLDYSTIPVFMSKEIAKTILSLGIYSRLLRKCGSSVASSRYVRRFSRSLPSLIEEHVETYFGISELSSGNRNNITLTMSPEASKGVTHIVERCGRTFSEFCEHDINAPVDRKYDGSGSFSFEFEAMFARIIQEEFVSMSNSIKQYILGDLMLDSHLQAFADIFLMRNADSLPSFLNDLFTSLEHTTNPLVDFHSDIAYRMSSHTVISSLHSNIMTQQDSTSVNANFCGMDVMTASNGSKISTLECFYFPPKVETSHTKSISDRTSTLIVRLGDFKTEMDLLYKHEENITDDDIDAFIEQQDIIGEEIVKLVTELRNEKVEEALENLGPRYALSQSLKVVFTYAQLDFYRYVFLHLLKIEFTSWTLGSWLTNTMRPFNISQVSKPMDTANDDSNMRIFSVVMSSIYGHAPLQMLEIMVKRMISTYVVDGEHDEAKNVATSLTNVVHGCRTSLSACRSILQNHLAQLRFIVFTDIIGGGLKLFRQRLKKMNDISCSVGDSTHPWDLYELIELHATFLSGDRGDGLLQEHGAIASLIKQLFNNCQKLIDAITCLELSVASRLALPNMQYNQKLSESLLRKLRQFHENITEIIHEAEGVESDIVRVSALRLR